HSAKLGIAESKGEVPSAAGAGHQEAVHLDGDSRDVDVDVVESATERCEERSPATARLLAPRNLPNLLDLDVAEAALLTRAARLLPDDRAEEVFVDDLEVASVLGVEKCAEPTEHRLARGALRHGWSSANRDWR